MKTGLEQGDHLNHGFDRLALAHDARPEPVADFGHRPDLFARNDKPWQPRVDGEYLFNERGGDGLVLTDGSFFVEVMTDLSDETQGGTGSGRSRQKVTAQIEQPCGRLSRHLLRDRLRLRLNDAP